MTDASDMPQNNPGSRPLSQNGAIVVDEKPKNDITLESLATIMTDLAVEVRTSISGLEDRLDKLSKDVAENNAKLTKIEDQIDNAASISQESMRQVKRDLENVKDEMAFLRELSSIATTPTSIGLLDEKQSYPESNRIYSTPAESKSEFDSVKKGNDQTGSDVDGKTDFLRKRVYINNMVLEGWPTEEKASHWHRWLSRYECNFTVWFESEYKEAAWATLQQAVPAKYILKYSEPDDYSKCCHELLVNLNYFIGKERLERLNHLQFSNDVLNCGSEYDAFRNYIEKLFNRFNLVEYDEICKILKNTFEKRARTSGRLIRSRAEDMVFMMQMNSSASKETKRRILEMVRDRLLELIRHAFHDIQEAKYREYERQQQLV